MQPIDSSTRCRHNIQYAYQCRRPAGSHDPERASKCVPIQPMEPGSRKQFARNGESVRTISQVPALRFPHGATMHTVYLDKIALVRDATKNLKQMSASFDGYHRVFCPHVLGTKDGVWRVHAWQFGGRSSHQENLPTWRYFEVNRLAGLASQTGEWHRGYVKKAFDHPHAFDHIDTLVDANHAAVVLGISSPRTPRPFSWPQAQKKRR